MPSAPRTSLQVSLAPTDYPHALHILPHQLRQWLPQVGEAVLVIDMHRSRSGRFTTAWEERRPLLDRLVADLCAEHPTVRAVEVDYSAEARRRVADEFFGGRPVPPKDLRGGPYYSYFYGLSAARHDVVVHTDSDMMFGGGSVAWMGEALAVMDADHDVLVCSPLPGPPTRTGALVAQSAPAYPSSGPAFRFPHISTRIFAMSRMRFGERIAALVPRRPGVRGIARALVQRNPVFDLPENVISRAMVDAGVYRVDLLGSGDGMWSLHPPHRSALFYETLPSVIARVESGDMPEAQRGRYDVHDSLVDWSSARAVLDARPWWLRAIRTIVGNPHVKPTTPGG